MPDNLTFEQWAMVGQKIGEINKQISWWVGDWINYGEHKYGEKYSQAMEATELDYGHLRNVASVARHFAPENRNQDLSFSHHALLTNIEIAEAKQIMNQTADKKLSVRELKKVLHESGMKKSDDKTRMFEGLGTCCNCAATLHVELRQKKQDGDWVTSKVNITEQEAG